jgi:uncharacterized Zn finger protein (UPF0148 family)
MAHCMKCLYCGSPMCISCGDTVCPVCGASPASPEEAKDLEKLKAQDQKGKGEVV